MNNGSTYSFRVKATNAVGTGGHSGTVTTTLSVPSQTHTSNIQAFSFGNLTISAGDTIIWKNLHSMPHTVTSTTGIWNSGTISPGSSFTRTFNTPGTYRFSCLFHPSMQGTITVQ